MSTESHNIRWEGRSSGKRSEDTLRLAAEHWYLEGPRPPKEKPNPHFAALPPKGELVGRRIKHFWPKMGRCARRRLKEVDPDVTCALVKVGLRHLFRHQAHPEPSLAQAACIDGSMRHPNPSVAQLAA